jgi:hypothetical protein
MIHRQIFEVDEMTSDEEDKYFEQRASEWREDKRREKRLDAIQAEERENVADVLDTTEEVAQEAIELGFDGETARVLPLVPMIQAAWADGKIQTRELGKVEELAEQYGIDFEGPDGEFFRAMLKEKPSEVFFERVDRVIAHLLETSDDDRSRSLIEHVREVAEASGGFFGLGDPIDEEEQKVLDQFAKLFDVD